MLSEAVVPHGKPIKLVVWDLDDTLWSTGAHHGDPPTLHPIARELIATLDERGILQSVVSSDSAHTHDWLRRLGVADYFLYPQIGVAAKPAAVKQIASALNIGLDAALLIDDDPHQRAEVARAHPIVRAVARPALARLAADPLMGHSLVGIEPRPRRLLYLEDQARIDCERSFPGSTADFNAFLAMRIAVAPAGSADVRRLKELVTRTNQLGATYSDDELAQLCGSPRHACLLVSLQDRFGDCGVIGLALLEVSAERWTLQLLVFSCRVASRGVSTIILHAILARARAAGVRCLAELKPTAKNQAMLVAYHQAGFAQIDTRGDVLILAHPLDGIPPLPAGVRLDFSYPPEATR